MKPDRPKTIRIKKRTPAPYKFILERVKTYLPNADLDLIARACEYSIAAHKGQLRRSGSLYVTHPMRVAYFLAKMHMDESCISAGALHDTLENTKTTFGDLSSLFGVQIASLVDGVTNISKAAIQSKAERRAGSFRRMLEAMTADRRILFIKMCDRLHNMQTLGSMSAEARGRIAKETMDWYVPLAARFGIYWLWRDLEELAFRHLEPESFAQITKLRAERIRELQTYEHEVTRELRIRLEQAGINGVIKSRNKTAYRIHQKFEEGCKDLDEIDDLVAFRVLLSETSECYEVLRMIHAHWQEFPDTFKDYIEFPKANKYQSLHTTVKGPEGRRTVIQIRTHEMERLGERGVAAQWSPSQKAVYDDYYTHVTEFIDRLVRSEPETPPLEFGQTLTEALYVDEVQVFTPKGDMKELPKGSTILDFAYAIHSELGNRCTGARIRGQFGPITQELVNGDSVEIITSENQEPMEEWLAYTRTIKAKRKIRQYLKSS